MFLWKINTINYSKKTSVHLNLNEVIQSKKVVFTVIKNCAHSSRFFLILYFKLKLPKTVIT